MKLLIDTEKEELVILDPASFLEVKAFLEQIEGGIGYTIKSKEQANHMPQVFPLFGAAIQGPDMDSTHYEEPDTDY